MITNSFDNQSEAIINPYKSKNAPKLDACILTFSYVIEEYVLKKYECEQIATLMSATGPTPVYLINYKGKRLGFFKTYVGAPGIVALIENSISSIDTDKYIVFGGAGCLNKEIARGKIMIPTEAYRDEGTSYHYMEASDYITIKNSDVVAAFMEKEQLPYILGKTWTTDAIFRETRNNFTKHQNDGCISVEMECSAVQAVCDFRDLDFYTFFNSGDLLDAPKWDMRVKAGEHRGTQHDARLFDLAVELAIYVTK